NLTRLLHAWEPLYRAEEVPPLVIIGKRGWLTGEFDAALEASPAREGVLFTGYVADGDLPALYGGATAFVFPSLYEGFGLPPLEAMACGTPVACSNTSSLPEVTGSAALSFDPLDVAAIRETLRRISGDVDLQAELRQRGLRRAKQFSWERAARETYSIYGSLLDR
ncbi:MAG: glycosyltransferase family 4 protein, partial [Anaerolineae bacterium]